MRASSAWPAITTRPVTARPPASTSRRLEDDFIDRFAVVGPAEEVVGRVQELASLGLERIVVVPGSLDSDSALVEETNARFAREVLPRLSA